MAGICDVSSADHVQFLSFVVGYSADLKAAAAREEAGKLGDIVDADVVVAFEIGVGTASTAAVAPSRLAIARVIGRGTCVGSDDALRLTGLHADLVTADADAVAQVAGLARQPGDSRVACSDEAQRLSGSDGCLQLLSQ